MILTSFCFTAFSMTFFCAATWLHWVFFSAICLLRALKFYIWKLRLVFLELFSNLCLPCCLKNYLLTNKWLRLNQTMIPVCEAHRTQLTRFSFKNILDIFSQTFQWSLFWPSNTNSLNTGMVELTWHDERSVIFCWPRNEWSRKRFFMNMVVLSWLYIHSTTVFLQVLFSSFSLLF